jgi:hypothetical protein
LNDRAINCGVFSFVYYFYGRNRNRDLNIVKQQCLVIQDRLNIGATMTIPQFEQLVGLPSYKTKQIIVLRRTYQNCIAFIGADFGLGKPPTWTPKDDTVFIVHDWLHKHFGVVTGPRSVTNTPSAFCYTCVSYHQFDTLCNCHADEETKKEIATRKKRREATLLCKECLKPRNQAGLYCKQCRACECGFVGKPDIGTHRCLSIKKPDEKKKDFLREPSETQQVELWAWDCESAQEYILENGEPVEGLTLQMDDEGYVWENNVPVTILQKRTYHHVNLIVAYSLSGRKMVWSDTDENVEGSVLDQFTQFMMENNNGYNRCYAHNSSGYDSRLLFEALGKNRVTPSFSQINRGTKFLMIKANHAYFCDSMLILPGGLANLAKAFMPSHEDIHHFPFFFLGNDEYVGSIPSKEMFFTGDMSPRDLQAFNAWHNERSTREWNYKTELALHCNDNGLMRKGHFPHLFNKKENYNYVGPIPDIKYFCLATSIRSKRQLYEFRIWHAYQRLHHPVWNFKNELLSYCENDVDVLLKLMSIFHDTLKDTYDVSPWYYPTLASFVSTSLRMSMYPGLELEEVGSKEEKNAKITDLAWNKYWGVQRDMEYYYTRQALFGGRTDLRHIYWNNTMNPEGVVDGNTYKAKSVDVVSLYPFVQLAFDYPVGLPLITIYDPDHAPCFKHCRESTLCSCLRINPENNVRDYEYKGYSILFNYTPPSASDILADDTFFGFATVSMTPPRDLFHPVLPQHIDGKCVFSFEPITGVFCTEEIKEALRCGYRLDRLHRLDKYNKAPGLWNDFMAHAIIMKTKNGSSNPSPGEQEAIVQGYESAFGLGDAIRASFPWGKNPAAKQCFKIIANCCWGKECQKPEKDNISSFTANDTEDLKDLMNDIDREATVLKGIVCLDNLTFLRTTNSSKVRVRLNDFYLPAGVMVPMYGRLVLFRELRKLGLLL